MSRSNAARLAGIAGALASLAGAAAVVRRRRLRRGGPMDVKEIARRLAEDPWRGKLDEVLEFVGDDYIAHIPGAPEPIRGKEGFRAFITSYQPHSRKPRSPRDDLLALGDLVVTRWTGRGTNTG